MIRLATIGQTIRRLRKALGWTQIELAQKTRDEILRISQSVTSLKFSKNANVFTERGVAMLSSVLSSEQAIQVNIHIMRAFVQVKRLGMTILDIRRRLDASVGLQHRDLYNMRNTTSRK